MIRYQALATDYDGTLAQDGRVDQSTLAALERLKASGRRLILVTGREWEELLAAFDHVKLFDLVVAENGALLVDPSRQKERTLGKRPPQEFIDALRVAGVPRLSVGRVIVATWVPHEVAVLRAIRDYRVDAQVIFNKGAVMVLPTGLNKATGLRAALAELSLSPHNAVGVGDAENDYAFLDICECSVAVANALPQVKDEVDFVTRQHHGAGVTELIDRLISTDLEELQPRLNRHEIPVGTCPDGSRLRVSPYKSNLLVTEPPSADRSSFAAAFMEQLVESRYQFCMLDAKGGYDLFEGAVVLGTPQRPPLVDEVLNLLERPSENAILNLRGIADDDRAAFFDRFLPPLRDLRARTGRPHWIVVDGADRLLPPSAKLHVSIEPETLQGVVLVTSYPQPTVQRLLPAMGLIVATGQGKEEDLQAIARDVRESLPAHPTMSLSEGTALAWPRKTGSAVFAFQPRRPKTLSEPIPQPSPA